MEAYRIKREIACIDLKSFYASVECVLRGLDPFETPLIVADKSRGQGSIVLAISPFLKAQGFPSRARIYELKDLPKDVIVAKPQMKTYMRFSRDVIEIYLKYIAKEDLHVYSVDEAFLDLTDYLTYYNMSAYQLTKTIMRDIYATTKIPASAGIGDNLLLSKLALDLKSKPSKKHLMSMRYADIKNDLWPIRPLSKMWSIGARMERRLNQLGMYEVGDVAKCDVKLLKKHFGIIGEELYYHAHGIDQAIIKEKHRDIKTPIKSVGLGQTLYQDYQASDIFVLLLEMADETAEKLRFIRKEAKTIHLSIGYSKTWGGGFSRQKTLDYGTDLSSMILTTCLQLLDAHYEGLPIRKIALRATKLQPKRPFEQLCFFESLAKKKSEAQLFEALDQIKRRFGKKSVLRLTSYFEAGTAKRRASLVGGHRG